MRLSGMIIIAAAIAISAPAAAQQAETSQNTTNRVLEGVTRCRSIAEAAARLACYDAASIALEAQLRGNNLVVLDREDVKTARRSLFGFSLPKIRLFNNDDDAREQNEIQTTLTGVRSLGYNKWQLTLEGGAVWHTIDALPAGDIPEIGSKVRVRRAALGSYLINIGTRLGVKARRVD